MRLMAFYIGRIAVYWPAKNGADSFSIYLYCGGVANLRAHQQMHRVWQITLLCFASTTTLAIILGLGAAHLFQTGQGLSLALFQEHMHSFEAAQLTTAEFFQKLVQGIFINPFAALAQGSILAVVVFALFVGIALAIKGEAYPQLHKLFNEGFAYS